MVTQCARKFTKLLRFVLDFIASKRMKIRSLKKG